MGTKPSRTKKPSQAKGKARRAKDARRALLALCGSRGAKLRHMDREAIEKVLQAFDPEQGAYRMSFPVSPEDAPSAGVLPPCIIVICYPTTKPNG